MPDFNISVSASELNTAITKANAAAPQSTTYTKSETNTLLAGKADLIDGKVPAAQLPSYVDDVLEYTSTADFPETGESGKIYIATGTNKTYRWSGSVYVEISESLALGETASTAYAGDKGKANADAITAIKDGTNIDSFADVETALADKADKSTTYTKTEVDTALAEKLNTSDVDAALDSTSTNPVQNKAVQASMAWVVDNGVKNMLPNRGTMSNSDITYTWTNGAVVVSGTKTAGSDVHVDPLPLTELSAFGLSAGDSVVLWNDGTRCFVGAMFWSQEKGFTQLTGVSNDSSTITIPTGYTHILGRLNVFASAAGTINETIHPMICSKAVWDASQKYVPYAPSNLELYEMILALQNGG